MKLKNKHYVMEILAPIGENVLMIIYPHNLYMEEVVKRNEKDE